MSAAPKIFPLIAELGPGHVRHPGGHNWPDLEIVVDTTEQTIVSDEIYLVAVAGREPVVKRCQLREGSNNIWLHPAVATLHAVDTVRLGGLVLPCQTIEFSDNYYPWFVEVHGRVLGFWAPDAGRDPYAPRPSFDDGCLA